MNDRILRILEYNRIIDMLCERCSGASGRNISKDLLPIESKEAAIAALANTNDAFLRISRHGCPSLGADDLKEVFAALKVKAGLSAAELLNIAKLLSRVEEALKFDKLCECEDSLSELFALFDPLTFLRKEIERCIISEDEISDDASADLKSIRRSIKNNNTKIHETLKASISSLYANGYLTDNLVTMRNNRYCLPVKAEYQGKVTGMLHDTSASGSTVFIEPMEVVRLNNEMSELFLREQKEIARILAALCSTCADNLEVLICDFDTLSKLDHIFAKGQLAKDMKASFPVFDDKTIDIKQARHPLIDPVKVVSVDIRFNDGINMLIITGPNTGGKTVCLKTLGLLSLMAQSGLFIPAFDGSRLRFFREIFADIGDEQSIEQSLSTFSSHMVNTVSILNEADSDCLTLFDELGAGTDPTEGAALATSILTFLHERNICTMATTHYSEIKLFALETEGVENASCEFDINTLRPTYRLLIGIPGKSNAFHISKRLGLSETIIENAMGLIDSGNRHFEDVIASLNEEKKKLEETNKELMLKEEEANKLVTQYETKLSRLEASRENILKKANEEAAEILSKAKDYADDTIRQYNKWQKNPDSVKEMESRRNDLNQKLKKKQKDKMPEPKKTTGTVDPERLHIGDTVMVNSMGIKGTVSTLPNSKGELFVQMGILRSQVNVKDLSYAKEDVSNDLPAKNGSGKIRIAKAATISPQINLIGMTVDEALSQLDKYLDDAVIAHLDKITIIHGRGTGALKNAVSAYLKKCPYVASYTLGEANQGGYGVTVAHLK